MHKLASQQRSGCNDRLACSRLGMVAYLSDRDRAIETTFLTCVDGVRWMFAKPRRLEVTTLNRADRSASLHLLHLSWSPSGSDLAAVDNEGGITIFTQSTDGGMTCQYSPVVSYPVPTSGSHSGLKELNEVVGMKWFDADRNVLLPGPASVATNAASRPSLGTYTIHQSRQCGPYHPVASKNACVVVTRRGHIYLLAQIGQDMRYTEIFSSLEQDGSDFEVHHDEMLSHAAWYGCRDNSLLVVTYAAQSRALKVYRMMIEWSSQAKVRAGAAANSNAGANGSANANSINPNQPIDGGTGNYRLNSSAEFASVSVRRVLRTTLSLPGPLSGIYVAPIPPQNHQTAPTSSAELEVDIYVVCAAEHESTIRHFRLSARQVVLNQALYTLGNRRDSVSSSEEQAYKLETVDSETVAGSIVSYGSASLDYAFYFGCDDGSVHIRRHKIHPNQKGPEGDPSKYIHSLADVGFKFPAVEKTDGSPVCTDLCLSPSLTSYVYLSASGKLHINYMTSDADYTDRDAYVASIVGLAHSNALSCFIHTCNDDLVYIARRELARAQRQLDQDGAHNMAESLIMEAYLAINFSLDPPKEYQIEKLMMNPPLQKLVSLQFVLMTGPRWHLNPSSVMAWCIIGLRLLDFALTFSLRLASQSKQPVTGDVDIKAFSIQNLLGLTRWCTDLLAYMCQELYQASTDANFYLTDARRAPTKDGKDGARSVVLSLLLGRIPRMLLVYALRGIRGLQQIASKFAEQEGPSRTTFKAAYRRYKETVDTAVVKLTSFEKMVTDIDNAMKTIATATRDPKDRLAMEQDLVIRAIVPAQLMIVARKTVEAFTKNLRPEIDLPTLYFYDVSWLRMQEFDFGVQPDDTAGAAWPLVSNGSTVDALRKTVLSVTEPSARLRQCSRCGSLSMWDDIETYPFTQWTIAFSKTCMCGGNWIHKSQAVTAA